MIDISKLGALEISAIVLILFVLALGIWIFLYLNYYSDWFRFSKKKDKKKVAESKEFIKNILVRIEHLLGNIDAYSEEMLLSEAEYYMKLFMIKTYNLKATNLTLIETFEKIEKDDLEKDESSFKEMKDVIEQYKIIGFSKDKISKEGVRVLLQEINEFFIIKRNSLNIKEKKISGIITEKEQSSLETSKEDINKLLPKK